MEVTGPVDCVFCGRCFVNAEAVCFSGPFAAASETDHKSTLAFPKSFRRKMSQKRLLFITTLSASVLLLALWLTLHNTGAASGGTERRPLAAQRTQGSHSIPVHASQSNTPYMKFLNGQE